MTLNFKTQYYTVVTPQSKSHRVNIIVGHTLLNNEIAVRRKM